MQKMEMLFRYLNFLSKSFNKYDVHSPFLFDLITNTFEDKINYTDYREIEDLKAKLINDKGRIEIKDLGAGSKKSSGKITTISQIAKNSSKPKKLGRLLYRLSKNLQPTTILELGTSFGLSSAYLALGNPNANMTTIEGCPNISTVAHNNFNELNINNLNLITGNFDDLLNDVLEKIPQIDLAYIDGNHRKEPTIRYFEQCLGNAVNDTCFIFDDIHWSEGMEQAWNYIKQNERVTLSVDIFYFGMVFFKKELTKQNFVIRF